MYCEGIKLATKLDDAEAMIMKIKTKLVINTYQLSFNISDALLREIAGEIVNSKILKL